MTPPSLLPRAVLVALLAAVAPVSVFANPSSDVPSVAQEVALPFYKSQTIADDLPARDLAVAEDGKVYILGKKALWTWATKARQLSRLALPVAEDSPLARLGSDGTSLFAASRATLFQLDPTTGRSFRYVLPAAAQGETLGFAGEGDHFYWLNTAAIARFDRYGRKVKVALKPPLTRDDGPIAFAATSGTLWFIRGQELLRWQDGKLPPQRIFRAKHRLLGMTRLAKEMVLHTAHTVLRLSEGGKLLQAIPVEGQRRLVTMHITAETHAYVFSDHLLEVYNLSTRTTQRFILPLAPRETILRLIVADQLVVVATAQDVRSFYLGR